MRCEFYRTPIGIFQEEHRSKCMILGEGLGLCKAIISKKAFWISKRPFHLNLKILTLLQLQ